MFPALTEERRKELVKVVKKIAEDHKVGVRNVRRDILKDLKDLEKKKEISEDEMRKQSEKIEQVIKEQMKSIDDLIIKKEKDIMVV